MSLPVSGAVSYCCSKVLCLLAYSKHGPKPPCPELRYHDDRYWCGILEDAPKAAKIQYMESLAIGAGCSSSMCNTVRDLQIAKMKKKETTDGK